MREVSPSTLQSMMAESTATALLGAITFTDPDGVQPTIRAVSNTVDIEYGGHTYQAIPFKLTLAKDTESQVPQAKISIDGVGQEVTAMVRQVTGRPTLDIEVLAVAPNGDVTREIGPLSYVLLEISGTASTLEATLGYDLDILNQSAQHYDFTPGVARALFS